MHAQSLAAFTCTSSRAAGEHASNYGAVPMVQTAGDVAPEKNDTSHGWKNTGKMPAVLVSVDLFLVETPVDPHVM